MTKVAAADKPRHKQKDGAHVIEPARDISVITITRRRPELLRRAIASVGRQAHVAEHIIVVDACSATMAFLVADDRLARLRSDHAEILVHASRSVGDHSGPGRSARLRNVGVSIASASWVAFLDDDNEWEPDHLSSLRAVATRTGSRAAHSQRQVFTREGLPYLEESFPWAPSEREGKRVYRELLSLGIVERGSCIRRDRLIEGMPLIDTSSWLLSRTLLEETPFCEEFTQQDEIERRGEDDKLLESLIERHEKIVCSDRATLRYYLGGYSNSSTGRDTEFSWSTVRT